MHLICRPMWFCEAVIFGNEHLSALKNAAKSRKSIDTVIGYDSFQENQQQIADMIKQEKQEELSKLVDTQPDAKTENPPTGDGDPATLPHEPSKPAMMDKLDKDDSAQWWKVAEKTMCQYVRLIVMPSSAENLTSELASHELGTVAGDACGLVMVHMDVKLSCEGCTAPFLRIPPLRPQNYEMMSQGVLGARAQPDAKLPKGDLVVLLNGGKAGHGAK